MLWPTTFGVFTAIAVIGRSTGNGVSLGRRSAPDQGLEHGCPPLMQLAIQMKNPYYSMRNLGTIALFLFGSTAFAMGDAAISGKVTDVNQSAHSFKVRYLVTISSRHGGVNPDRKSGREQTFQTTDKTTYSVGSSKGSWANVTKGVSVNLTSHAGVADNVQIVSGS
jgi:hypothetical protein